MLDQTRLDLRQPGRRRGGPSGSGFDQSFNQLINHIICFINNSIIQSSILLLAAVLDQTRQDLRQSGRRRGGPSEVDSIL